MKHFLILAVTLVTGIVLFFALGPSPVHPTQNRRAILTECMTEKAPVHYHITLKMSYLGRPMPLPNNIGIDEECMRPLDTHDGSSNEVHIHYARPYPFTIGDFFTVWGVIFNKDQFSGTFASERRRIIMKVNGTINYEYENYVLKDRDVIEIAVTPGYTL